MIGNKTINYSIYSRTSGGRIALQDTKNVKRPDIEYQSDTIKGPGILGEIDMPTLAAVSSMSHEIGLRRETVESASLMAPEIHELEIDWDTDVLNPTSGKIEVSHNKEIIKCLPKSFSPGSIEGNTSEDGTLKVEDLYYKRIQDGKALDEIDKLNGKLMINGVDYTSQISDL